MKSFLETTKALSDQARVRAYIALKERELCVCQITELLQLAPSTVSKHMSILDQVGLLHRVKKGRWIYYKSKVTNKYLDDWLDKTLSDNQIIKRDLKCLQGILKIKPEELCRKQMKK